MGGRSVALRALAAQIEPFELVEPVDPLVVNPPAFSSKQRVDAPVAARGPASVRSRGCERGAPRRCAVGARSRTWNGFFGRRSLSLQDTARRPSAKADPFRIACHGPPATPMKPNLPSCSTGTSSSGYAHLLNAVGSPWKLIRRLPARVLPVRSLAEEPRQPVHPHAHTLLPPPRLLR